MSSSPVSQKFFYFLHSFFFFFPSLPSSFPFFYVVFLFCCYSNNFRFSWTAERRVHPDYFQGRTQNVFFAHVQNVTHREKASASTPGKAASSALAKRDPCLWLTKKPVHIITPLPVTYFTWLFEDLMARFPDPNSQSYHFSRGFTQWSKQNTRQLVSEKFWKMLTLSEVLV